MKPSDARDLVAISRIVVLSGLSLVALLALFLVAWAVYAPIAALLMAPLALGAGAVFHSLPIATLNSGFAIVSGAWLAAATVMAVFRVLMRRVRARRRGAGRYTAA
jgi:hypothetical protein